MSQRQKNPWSPADPIDVVCPGGKEGRSSPSEGLTCDSAAGVRAPPPDTPGTFLDLTARTPSHPILMTRPQRLACIILRHTQRRGSGRLKILCFSASCRVFEADLGRGLAPVPSYDVCLSSRQWLHPNKHSFDSASQLYRVICAGGGAIQSKS